MQRGENVKNKAFATFFFFSFLDRWRCRKFRSKDFNLDDETHDGKPEINDIICGELEADPYLTTFSPGHVQETDYGGKLKSKCTYDRDYFSPLGVVPYTSLFTVPLIIFRNYQTTREN